MASGEPFRKDQLDRLNRIRQVAERTTGVGFHVRVGALPGDPERATARLLADLVASHQNQGTNPGLSTGADAPPGPALVLVAVSPGQRFVRVATSPAARSRISDTAALLATLSMASSFAVGDLVGGLVAALRQLADAAGPATQRRGAGAR